MRNCFFLGKIYQINIWDIYNYKNCREKMFFSLWRENDLNGMKKSKYLNSLFKKGNIAPQEKNSVFSCFVKKLSNFLKSISNSIFCFILVLASWGRILILIANRFCKANLKEKAWTESIFIEASKQRFLGIALKQSLNQNSCKFSKLISMIERLFEEEYLQFWGFLYHIQF